VQATFLILMSQMLAALDAEQAAGRAGFATDDILARDTS
jgi:hypothetical protein